MINSYLRAVYAHFLWLFMILVFRTLWFFLHNLTPFVLVMLPNFLSPAWVVAKLWVLPRLPKGTWSRMGSDTVSWGTLWVAFYLKLFTYQTIYFPCTSAWFFLAELITLWQFSKYLNGAMTKSSSGTLM